MGCLQLELAKFVAGKAGPTNPEMRPQYGLYVLARRYVHILCLGYEGGGEGHLRAGLGTITRTSSGGSGWGVTSCAASLRALRGSILRLPNMVTDVQGSMRMQALGVCFLFNAGRM
jgi:hypothetical protein